MENMIYLSNFIAKCSGFLSSESTKTTRELKRDLNIQSEACLDDLYLICNGKIVYDDAPVEAGRIYHVVPRICGGKGGFGSMLRAIGAQIEKTTNREALRDLSGRRMRDVNNEKKLKEWLGKQSERDEERQKKREERRARKLAEPRHKFDDPTYEQQKSLVLDNLDDAVQEGLQRAQSKPSATATVTSASAGPSCIPSKRKAAENNSSVPSKVRKDTEWLGIDIEDLSDSEEEESARASPTVHTATCSTSTSDDQSCSDSESSRSKDLNSDILNHGASGGISASGSTFAETNELRRVKPFGLEECSDSKDLFIPDSVLKYRRDNQNGDVNNVEKSHNENTEKQEGDTTESEPRKHGLLTALDNVPKSNDENIAQKPEEEGPFILDECESVEDLEVLGLDRLKAELMTRGLKCGGTLQQRAERLYSVKGLPNDLIDPSLFAKSTNGKRKKRK